VPFEVAVKSGVRVRHRVDERISKVDVQAIHALQDEGISIQNPHLLSRCLIDIRPPAHTPILRDQQTCKRWRGIETLHIEGPERCRVDVVPGGTRKDHAHERVHQLLVLDKDGGVRDGLEQRWGLLQSLLDLCRKCTFHRVIMAHSLLPESHQWRQAELSREWKGIGTRSQIITTVAGHK
jgi:hypothetical protein